MEKDKELQLKEAISMVTGRKAKLPPSIWKNPIRMQSGGWKIIEKMDNPTITPNDPTPLSTNQTAPTTQPNTLSEQQKSMLEMVLGTTEVPVVEVKKRGRKKTNQ